MYILPVWSMQPSGSSREAKHGKIGCSSRRMLTQHLGHPCFKCPAVYDPNSSKQYESTLYVRIFCLHSYLITYRYAGFSRQ